MWFERVTTGTWNLSKAKISVRGVMSDYIGIMYFLVGRLKPPLPLKFLPACHQTKICLENTLTLISAFQRNFSASVCLIYGVRNMIIIKFLHTLKTVGAIKTHIFGWITLQWVRLNRNFTQLSSYFVLWLHLFQKFSIKF